jgi:modification methylase
MPTQHKIIIGDARRIEQLADTSVHLVVTSPPYWQLKDYGSNRQIGFHDSYEEYINNLNLVWLECYRVLHNGCRMCINIGDQFARSVYYGRYKVIPIRTEIIKFCETIGMDYMGAIIWQKVTTTNTTGGATIMGSFPYPRNGILKIDYEFILIFKKQGKPPAVDKNIKKLSRLSTADWNTYFSGHWKFPGEKQHKHLAMFPLELPYRLIRMFSFVDDTVLDPFLGSGTTSLAAKILDRNSIGYEINPAFIKIIRNKLKIPARKTADNCIYELIRNTPAKQNFQSDLNILPYRFTDPHRMNRRFNMAKKNSAVSPDFNSIPSPHHVIPAKVVSNSLASNTSPLPQDVIPAKAGIYLPKGVSKPNFKTYGSKISSVKPLSQFRYFKVREILSPEKIKLNNGKTIRLLGIAENPRYRRQAVKFLQHKGRSQNVYLKFDPKREAETGDLQAYVYLKNRTFLNAHLIKSGFVFVDTENTYTYRDKFIQLFRTTVKI